MSKLLPGDLHRDYDLCQAFDLLGNRLFPGLWNGHNELFAKPAEHSAEAIRQKAARIETRKTEIRQGLRQLDQLIARATSHEKQTVYEEDRQILHEEFVQLENTLENLPSPNGLADRSDIYERRSQTEKRLIDALAQHKLSWWCMGATPRDDRIWDKTQHGFHYNIALSCIWWPRKVSGPRRQFVRLHHTVFDEWLERNFPQGQDKKSEAEAWFRLQMKSPDNPDWRKADYEDHMQRHFSIGARAFLKLWTDSAPHHMRKPGRRKSKQP
ncbi:hypothetical protein JCM17845_29360 [Iodidimonas gelatinilytica]|uniref:Uncharacterized protein n=1 Tax=Iodidimonas gelatinilytica TaxID=1236966 RepID=A0A5A7N215_9PROT|nr:hypothetical protein [Iodidimonas gelatinilytica]GER02313.1 hypothetical protein JCM17845_29360 [Iodidimonas gelatinilytica]